MMPATMTMSWVVFFFVKTDINGTELRAFVLGCGL